VKLVSFAKSGRGQQARDGTSSARGSSSTAPVRPGLVLTALILVAAVANLNLLVASVALPDIGKAFNAGQVTLNLVAVGFSLGLAGSVLYLGAVGDRYGRKMMLISGTLLSIPACLLAAFAPSIGVLFAARVLGGIAAGMAFPTTLALITALWSGPARTSSIALWSAIGGASTALGPLIAGTLLATFWWGSVFIITLPLAVIAAAVALFFVPAHVNETTGRVDNLGLALFFVPAHVNETTGRVDNLGGVLSVLLVAALILMINLAPVPDLGTAVIGLGVVALAALIAFAVRQRHAAAPLYDLRVAGRRIFWVAACAGIVVFGSLMGGMFVGQQFMQNVLGYSPFQAGLAIIPAAAFMIGVAPHSARLIERHGSRLTLLAGYFFVLLAFLVMLLTWKEGTAYWKVGLGYALIGTGVGLAGTPASHSLTGSVPVKRAGMASATADLQRDLGGAIMQSILGALLAAGYAASITAAIGSAPHSQQITTSVQGQLTKSFAGAEGIAKRYPQYASQITAAAKESFLHGDHWAYAAGILAVLLGTALVYFMFPGHAQEKSLLAGYHASDLSAATKSRG